MDTSIKKKSFKEKFFSEFVEYWMNVLYLTIVFGLYAVSRRLILSHYDVILEDYFYGLIKALVLAKVIMIGAAFKIDRLLDHKPLIIPIIYKSLIFNLWVALFSFAEGYIHQAMAVSSMNIDFDLFIKSLFTKKWFGEGIVVIMSFLPFFAFKEISKVVGEDKVREMLFKGKR